MTRNPSARLPRPPPQGDHRAVDGLCPVITLHIPTWAGVSKVHYVTCCLGMFSRFKGNKYTPGGKIPLEVFGTESSRALQHSA